MILLVVLQQKKESVFGSPQRRPICVDTDIQVRCTDESHPKRCARAVVLIILVTSAGYPLLA